MPWGVPKIGSLVEVASGNITLTEPASVAQGDLMVACIGYRSNAAFTLPSGWTLCAPQQSSGDTDATNGIASGVMAYIVRGASAPSLVFTRTGGDVAQGRIISYSGGGSSPYVTGSSATLGSASATVTTATLTTPHANCLIVAMSSAGDTLSASAFDAATDPTTASGATDTTTAPTAGTWIERADNSTGTGADHGLAIADAVRATAGATGTIQATISASARHVMIAAVFTQQNAPTVALNSPADASSDSDTTPTLEFTGTDSNGDDVRYNIQIDTVNTFDSGETSLLDSYSESNKSADYPFYAGFGFDARGQSFAVTDAVTLYSAKFYLRKVGSPTGNATIALYAHLGTFGSSSIPTGSPLVSRILDVSTLTTSYQLIESLLEYSLQAGTNYVITVAYSGGDVNNKIELGGDNTSPTHAGNYSQLVSGTWTAFDSIDLCFYVYTIVPPSINEISGTDSGFLNTVTGGDTDPFNSGEKVSFTVQAGDALASGTYYWRVRGIDPTGSNTYGAWSSTRSFTVTAGGAATFPGYIGGGWY
jgi:hypothetical protein